MSSEDIASPLTKEVVEKRENPYVVAFSIIALLEDSAHDLSVFRSQGDVVEEKAVEEEIVALLQDVTDFFVYKILFFHFLRDIMHHGNRCLYVYDLWKKLGDPQLEQYIEVHMHLHNCIINDFYPLFEGLLTRGYNVNCKEMDRSLLHTAALHSLRYTHLLLQHGAVFRSDAMQLTPAHYALHNVNGEGEKILNLFQSQGIDVEHVRNKPYVILA